MKKRYESIILFNAALADDEREKLVSKFTKIISDAGTVIKVEQWGRRKLMYPIDKQVNGYYVYIFFEAEPSHIAELERNYRLTDAVLRHMTTVEQKGVKPPEEKKEAEVVAGAEVATGGQNDKQSTPELQELVP